MVTECQFLIDWMLEAKKRDHSIYEVVRKKEFIKNVNSLNNCFPNSGDECLALAQKNDNKGLAKFIVNNPKFQLFPEIAKIRAKATKMTLPFILAENDNLKGLQLLLSTVKDEKEVIDIIQRVNSEETSLILWAMACKSEKVFEYLKHRTKWNVNWRPPVGKKGRLTPLMWAVQNQKTDMIKVKRTPPLSRIDIAQTHL